MGRVLFLTAATVVVIAATLADTGGGASSRIVDRTFVCTPVATYASQRDVDVFADPPLVTDFGRYPAHIGVASGPESPGYELLMVRARSQKAFGNYLSAGGVFANARRCSAARASVPLSPKGLPGPPISWGKKVECSIRGRVLVRVRAVLEAPAPWRKADRWYDGARKSVDEASLAVRSARTGEPIAFMQMDKAGTTQLWFSPRCSS